MNMALRMAPGAEGVEAAPAHGVEQDFSHDAAGGIAGAEKQDVKGLSRHAIFTAVGGNPVYWPSNARRIVCEAARAGYRGVPPAEGPR